MWQGYKVPGVSESDDEAAKTIPILSPVLWHSRVMQRLQELQATLDGTDISHLAQRFAVECPESELFDPALLPQPSGEELRQFVDLYLSKPNAGKSDEWSLRESLVAYALSATFKDCSVFITCPLVSTSDGWKLDEPQATVKVIDLDLKPLANMRKWYDLDEKIWRHWHATKSIVEPEMVADKPSDNLLATPAQITRSAIPSRLASSSTEALYQPTPDRQINDSMGFSGDTPSVSKDASSTRALHSRTPEDSQPSTPKAGPASNTATPASMSLSDALFISPSAAAIAQAPTPASMSLSDALFISPSAGVPAQVEPTTPASMSFSDALFISPSAAMQIATDNGRRGSTFGLEESPQILNSHGHDEEYSKEGREEDVVENLRPDTPKRAARSPGPSPSPRLVAAASNLHLNDTRAIKDESTSSPKKDYEDTIHKEQATISKGDHESTSNSTIPAVKYDVASTIQVPHESTYEGVVPKSTLMKEGEALPVGDLPSSPSAEDQQHFRSIIAGVTDETPVRSTTEATDHDTTRSTSTGTGDEVVEKAGMGSQQEQSTEEQNEVKHEGKEQLVPTSAEDRPPTPLADRQQHVRAVLAGVADKEETPTILSDIRMEAQTSTTAEQITPSITPPFVTPMTFAEDVEPTYPEKSDPAQSLAVETKADNETKPDEAKPAMP
jgi:hypothetical protein